MIQLTACCLQARVASRSRSCVGGRGLDLCTSQVHGSWAPTFGWSERVNCSPCRLIVDLPSTLPRLTGALVLFSSPPPCSEGLRGQQSCRWDLPSAREQGRSWSRSHAWHIGCQRGRFQPGAAQSKSAEFTSGTEECRCGTTAPGAPSELFGACWSFSWPA